MDTLKGRILDIPKSGITVTDDQGKVLARNFKFTLTGTRMAQPDPSRAAFNTAQLKVVKATNAGGRETWNVTVPMKRLIENTSDVVREIVGEDADFEQTDSYSKLLIAMLAASRPETELNCPTYSETQFSENGRWFYANDAEVGRQAVSIAANAETEIVREIKNEETGEVSYRLRVPRGADGSGYDFCTVSQQELLSGQFHFPGRAVSVHSAVKLAMCMGERFGSLNAADKLKLAQDEMRQYVQENQQKQVAAWGFREWNLSR
ncbi:MAG: hypothetical protein JST11_01110 [Acidobacteria bacterium]|nr:hypothetical protein [Acidobacteriota bacterium]